jgi:hypothetical protein
MLVRAAGYVKRRRGALKERPFAASVRFDPVMVT